MTKACFAHNNYLRTEGGTVIRFIVRMSLRTAFSFSEFSLSVWSSTLLKCAILWVIFYYRDILCETKRELHPSDLSFVLEIYRIWEGEPKTIWQSGCYNTGWLSTSYFEFVPCSSDRDVAPGRPFVSLEVGCSRVYITKVTHLNSCAVEPKVAANDTSVNKYTNHSPTFYLLCIPLKDNIYTMKIS